MPPNSRTERAYARVCVSLVSSAIPPIMCTGNVATPLSPRSTLNERCMYAWTCPAELVW